MSVLICMKKCLACTMSQVRLVCSSKNTSHLTDNSFWPQACSQIWFFVTESAFSQINMFSEYCNFPSVTIFQHVSVLLRTSRKSRQLTVAWCVRHLVTSIQKPAFHCAGERSAWIQFLLSRDGLGDPQSRSRRYREDNSCSCRKTNIVSLVVYLVTTWLSYPTSQ
jgi:hypothetical protein